MKKMIKRIGAIALSCMTMFCITSCKLEDAFIEDGDFIYYNLKTSYMKEDGYAIVGSTEQGKEYKEDVYVPAYFKGKEVTRTSFTEYGAYGGVKSYALAVNCKNLYFNYIQNYPTFAGTAEYIFTPESRERMSSSMDTLAVRPITGVLYISKIAYNYFKNLALTSANAESVNEINGYILHRVIESNGIEYYITTANISYMFNYKDSPNNDYFFINNFESEGLIEDTPYEPIRKGYTFAGWYKEPECENIWNFEEDRLPKFEYDSEGYITNFVETKLYAKWIKE